MMVPAAWFKQMGYQMVGSISGLGDNLSRPHAHEESDSWSTLTESQTFCEAPYIKYLPGWCQIMLSWRGVPTLEAVAFVRITAF